MIGVKIIRKSKENNIASNGGIITGTAAPNLYNLITNKLDKATFDDLFEKVALSGGGYAIRAKYAFYTNEWMSCLGANPDAGAVALGATTLGGLNNVVAAADEVSAAAKVLVREAGASSWTLKSLSDIVGLDTTALATYLSSNGYAKQSWVEAKGYLTQQSLADYATKVWVQAQGYLTAITKAQVEAVLTGNITSHTHSQYLTTQLAAQTYQPVGDYATNSALNSAVSSLNTAIGKKLDASVFDDLFVKEADGNGGYRIRAKYAFYTNEWMSCLGANPGAGTTTPSTPGVDLDAVRDYLTQQGYATQAWVQAQGYLKAADLSAYALADNAYLKNQQNRKSNAHTVASLTAVANSSDSWVNNYSFSLVNNNNALNFYVGGVVNERQALIQSGHSSNGYAQVLGVLHLNKLGGAVYINNSLALNAANVGSYAVTLDTEQTISGKKTFTAAETAVNRRLYVNGAFDTFDNYPHYMWHVAGTRWTKAVMDNNGNMHFVDGGASGFASYKSIKALAFVVAGGTSSQILMADGSVKALTDITSAYVTALGTSGNYLTWSKNGATNNITVPYATNTSVLNSHGRLTAVSGAKHGSGVRLYEVYHNGYPTSYGNVLAVQGSVSSGAGELLMGWSGSNAGHTSLYYRNCRDTNNTWSPWVTILDSANYSSILDGRYLRLSGGTMANTNLVTNLNADLLDGVHLIDIRGVGYAMQDTWIDASSLNENTWYPVRLPIGSNNNTRIEVIVSLNSGTKPSWSTHQSGFSVRVVWDVNGSGWGGSPVVRTIFRADYAYCSMSPVRGIGQMSNSSNEYVYVRGGGKYRFRTSHGITPLLLTAAYTTNSQTIAPTTTAPAEIGRTNALISDNVASATKLQTARQIYGVDFDGSDNVNGAFLWDNGDATLRIYDIVSYVNSAYGRETIGIQSCFDGEDPQTSSYVTSYYDRCLIALQPRGGRVAIGKTSAGFPLDVKGDIMADGWVRTAGARGWYNETYGGGWYMSDTQWIRAHNNKGIFSQGEFLSGYCFVRDGYAGRSWNQGYGALGVGIINNDQQTPLVMAYRSGTAIDVVGANRLFSMELLNAGTQLRFGFGGTLRFLFTSDGVFSSTTGMYSDGYMSCLGKNDGSDERLKTILGDVTLPIDVILAAPAKRFTWNANAGAVMAGKVAVGTLAQYWLEHLTEVVGTMPTGYYGVNYGTLDWIAIHSVAKYAYNGLSDHERRISALERENKELKSEINELKRRLAA